MFSENRELYLGRKGKNWCTSQQTFSCCVADVKMVTCYHREPEQRNVFLLNCKRSRAVQEAGVVLSSVLVPESCRKAYKEESQLSFPSSPAYTADLLPQNWRHPLYLTCICWFCLSWLPLPHAELMLEVIQLNCFLQLLTLNWLFSMGSFKWCPRGSTEPEIPVNPGISKAIKANRAQISLL